jgi:phage tail sheath protein FI
MPEYLAPAVYVEEVDTGSKPIEGVSTSTSGFVGVTERGPVNVPILVTSNGEYQRWFGQSLNPERYNGHCYMPHAVDGFFTNGGKRLYVTRVLEPSQALAANRRLVAPDLAAPAQARLLVGAAAGSNVIVIDADPGFTPGQTLQVGNGVGADYQDVAAVPPIVAANVLGLRHAVAFDHAAPSTVDSVAISDTAPAATNGSPLAFDVASGATALTLTNIAAFAPGIAAGQVLRVGVPNNDEELVVVAGPNAGNRVPLTAPVSLRHAAGTVVQRQTIGAVSASAAIVAGTPVAPTDASVNLAAALAVPAGEALRFNDAVPLRVEYRRVGALSRLPLAQGTYAEYPSGTAIERVAAVGGLVPAGGGLLTAVAAPGATVITVDDRSSMNPGDLLGIGTGVDREFIEIAFLPGTVPPPNPGNVVLRAPLRRNHTTAPPTTIVRYAPLTTATLHTVIALDAAAGDLALTIADSGIAAGSLLRVTPAVGGPYFHEVAAPIPLAPRVLPLANPLATPQRAGSTVARRLPMISVRALDAGDWGNRLRVGMEPQDPPLLMTTVRQVLPGGRLRLASAAGVEAGSELLVTDSAAVVTPLKVAAIDRNNDFEITLDAGTPLPGLVAKGDAVRSREYRFVLELLRQADPANPSRNNTPIDREVFASLSLDTRHSRYFQRVIGATWNLLNPATAFDDMGRPLRRADRRSEGESGYVRVLDLAPTTALRPGPVFTRTTPPGSTPRLDLLPLGNGTDMIPGITDGTYIGLDNVDPELRTGLFALRNIDEVSIVAVPGGTSPAIQNALINHCELMRYRFAVLDGHPPPQDSMADIQFQRQQFDTKYAALYHPWLLIPDPYPTTQGAAPDYPIPPSGHMVGIYARTDIERGVHKAPANEVVRGVIGLQRVLNKEQHDILNPYPVNINVIRDFRPVNRGIRVYGGRCITSDSDWKYVNVRRLLIFIEASVDRGLQWVVFEPNAEPLWARVRRSITNFLTLVWRNGALEGTKVEEAFFVKCDRTTMTQTDIDQGRLICLVGVAPVKPAEFVIVRIGLWTAHADD